MQLKNSRHKSYLAWGNTAEKGFSGIRLSSSSTAVHVIREIGTKRRGTYWISRHDLSIVAFQSVRGASRSQRV